MSSEVIEAEKICGKCQVKFPRTLDYFKVAKGNKDGLHTYCRPCELAAKRVSWHKHAERINAQRRNNPEKRREQFNAWLAKHPDYFVGWYARHQEVLLARAKARYEENPTKFRAQGIRAGAARRSRIAALPNLLTDIQREEALDFWHGCCAVCGSAPGDDGKALAHDHWIALSDDQCPGTMAWNSVPLCDGRNGCNTKKRNLNAYTFLRRYFKDDAAAADQTFAEITAFLDMMRERYDTTLVGGATL